jgi:hypothetical protein
LHEVQSKLELGALTEYGDRTRAPYDNQSEWATGKKQGDNQTEWDVE